MRVSAVRRSPQPHVDAGGGDAAAADGDRADDLARQRVEDIDGVGARERIGTPDADIAATVDREASMTAEASGDEIGHQALAAPAGVQAHAGRAVDRAGPVADGDLAPPGAG